MPKNRLNSVKKIALIIFSLLLLAANDLSAQKRLKNLPNYNNKKLHFGFSIGLNFYNFNIQQIENLADVSGYYRAEGIVNPGYNVNIVTNLRLAEYLDFRFLPGFASTNRLIEFDVIEPLSQERQIVKREIVSSFFEFPFELKYRSKRVDNYGLYVTTGFKYNLDLSSNENVEDDRLFKIRGNDLGYELGFGIDMYFEFFKFSPQIKATFGVNNLLVQDGTFYVEGIERLETRAILLNFTFE